MKSGCCAVAASWVFFSLLLIVGCRNMTVTHVPGGIPFNVASTGLYYALPETVVIIKLPVTRVATKTGDLFHLVKQNDRQFWKVPAELTANSPLHVEYKLGVPDISTAARPDPSQLYRIDIDSAPNQDRELLMELSEMGLLTVGEASLRDRTVDYVVAAIKAASRAASALYPAAAGSIEVKNIDVLKGEVRDLRQRRLELISGKTSEGLTSISKEALELMLKELDAEEETLLARVWSRSEQTGNVLIEAVPGSKVADYVVGRLDHMTGALVTNAALPEQWAVHVPQGLFASVSSAKVSSEPDAHTLRVDFARLVPGRFDANSAPGNGSIGDLGLRYRVPALTRIHLLHGTNSLAHSDALVSQLGAVAALPARFNSFDSRVNVKLYESTGALKSVQSKTTALDPALIDKLGDAAENFAKAEANRRAASASEPSRLKRVTDRLGEFQALVKKLGELGLPVPAWAIEEASSDGGSTE